MVANLDRNKLIQYREKKSLKFNDSIFFKNTFDKNIENIKYLYKNCFKKTIKEKENNEFKNFNIFVINKMQPNLKMIMVHDFKIPVIYKNSYRKCDNSKCKTCLFSDSSFFVKLTDNFNLPIFDNSNCLTENCIYFIMCKFCNFFYIGQTVSFKKRLSNHRHNIKCFVPFKDHFCCVAVHFNLKGH